MAKILPIFDLPDFIYTIDLGSLTYRVRFNWDTREERWYFSLFEADETPIITGVKVLHDSPLLYNLALSKFDHGYIMAYGPTSNFNPPNRETLLTDFTIIYKSFEEVNEFISTNL
jgi:hypothetical protein